MDVLFLNDFTLRKTVQELADIKCLILAHNAEQVNSNL